MPYKEGVKSDFFSPKLYSPASSQCKPTPCVTLRSRAVWVGAALCCEEAGGSTEDSRFGHGPLRSTRLLLQ